MQPVLALASSHDVTRNRVSVLIVVAVAVATYVWVQAYRRQMPIAARTRWIFVGCGVIACVAAAVWARDELDIVFSTTAITYLLVVCLMLCPFVGVLSWIQNGKSRPDRQRDRVSNSKT